MKKTLLLSILSVVAMAASVQADDSKAPTPKPALTTEKAQTATPAAPVTAAVATPAASMESCCGDSGCKPSATKVSVLMSPKTKSLAMK